MRAQTIFFNAQTQDFLMDSQPIENLAPLEQSVLAFFVKKPYVKHTKDSIIENCWEDPYLAGVTDDSLYAVIASLRRKIGTSAHVATWRGSEGSGYRFFPTIDPETGQPQLQPHIHAAELPEKREDLTLRREIVTTLREIVKILDSLAQEDDELEFGI